VSEPRFFAPELSGEVVALTGAEAGHLRDARRLKVGQQVTLFDGAGGQARAEITRLGRDHVELRRGEVERVPRAAETELCVAAAVCKGPRQDWLIEKCTELGVAEIMPVISGRSVVRPSADGAHRWRRRSIESAKQSGQAWLPIIHPPRPMGAVLAEVGRFEHAWLTDPRTGCSLWRVLAGLPRPPASGMLLIGPEGGFAPQEMAEAVQASVVCIRLGPTILRVETAAVAAAALVLMRPGEASK
jgi:16S rRNA (uracil1498-N3)-methyltransferase